MRDWRVKLDEFPRFNERQVLPDAGHTSREDADRIAHEQYALFEQRRRAVIEAKAETALFAQADELEAKVKEYKKGKSKPKKK